MTADDQGSGDRQKSPLFLSVSKTTRLPSLVSPPVSMTPSESQIRIRTAGCQRDNTEDQTTLPGGGTAL